MRMELDADGKHIVLDAPTTSSPLIRTIPGVRHDSKRQLWLLPLSWASCVTARGVLGQFEIGPALHDWAEAERVRRIDPALVLRTAADVAGDSYWGVLLGWTEGTLMDEVTAEGARAAAPRRHLRPDQRAGAAFLATAGSALLGDEMRLGKTPQTIRALQLLAEHSGDVAPTLVVAPNSVKAVWAATFADWWPEVRVVVAGSGTAAARKAVQAVAEGEADVLIINYEALPNLSNLAHYSGARKETCSACDPLSTRNPSRCQTEPKELNGITWATVIADEVHRVKDPRALQTRALWALGDQATHRFGLTGTPPERPDEFWAVMRFVSPKDFPGKTAFIDRYVLTIPNIWSGFSDTVGFKPETRPEFDRILLPQFIRRTREMVFPDDLPPIYMPRYVELTGKQLKAYKDFAKKLVAEVDNGVIFASNPLTKLVRLRQFAAAYGTMTDEGKLLLAEPSSKLDEFEALLEELGHEQAVVFAESRQLIDMLAARLDRRAEQVAARKSNVSVFTYGCVTGTQSPEERADEVAAFQDGGLDLLLCTVGAGGEGLTMNAADTAIFLQRPWSATKSEQSEKRIYLPGTGASTTIIDIITRGTVEEHVAAVLADKADQLEELVHDKETLKRWLK